MSANDRQSSATVPGDRLIFLIACGILTLLTITAVAAQKAPQQEQEQQQAGTDEPPKASEKKPQNALSAWLARRRAAAQHAQRKNNLKQLGLALHNYHETYARLPPGGVYAIKGDKKIPHHSWGSSILPQIDQAPVFAKINFSSPWNAKENQAAFKQEVPVYLQPGVKQTSDKQGLALNHYSGNKNAFFENSSMGFRDFRDGLSNTMLIGEINEGFMPWGQPGNWRDLALGLEGGKKQFGSSAPDGGVVILMGDGSVRTLAKNTDKAILKALSTPAGGERLQRDRGR